MRHRSISAPSSAIAVAQRLGTLPSFGWTRLLDVFLVTLIFSLFG